MLGFDSKSFFNERDLIFKFVLCSQKFLFKKLQMKIVIAAVLLLAILVSVEAKPACLRRCSKIYRPVCGSDRITYGNLCWFKAAQCKSYLHFDDPALPQLRLLTPVGPINRKLTLAHMGKCTCNTRCLAVYRPVCGSDGKTYGNKCGFEAACCKNPALRFSYSGACHPNPCPRRCSKIYRPVCGSDGKTYGNKCMFRIGKCKVSGLTLAHKGKCSCDRACTMMYQPLCGSDGKTYSNKCTFKNAQCKNPALRFSHVGACGDKPCPRFCTMEYDPRCGSNGEQYSNKCLLGIAQCQAKKNGEEPITEVPCVSTT